MRKKRLVRTLCCAGAMGMTAQANPSLAQLPEAWTPVLEQSGKANFHGSSDSLRITIGKLSPHVTKTLVLELDDIDVTTLVDIQGEQMVYQPPQPLDWGDHTLRLVEYAADGNILERGTWTFEVRKSASFREAEFQANLGLTVSHRVAEDDATDANVSGRTTAQGSANLSGMAANEKWRVTGVADLIYDSEKSKILDENGDARFVSDRELDLGTFLVTSETGPVTVQAGHHAPAPNSLIMQDFNRRGISTSVSSQQDRHSFTAFAVRTDNIYGFQNGLGVGDSDARTDGVTVTSQPLTHSREAFYINATYISSDGQDQIGAGEGGEPFQTGGQASSLVLDGTVLNKRLRLRGEIARSEYDFDGVNTGFNPEKDDAHAFLAMFTSNQKLVKEKPLFWYIGAEKKRIGSFFRTQANPGGVQDRDLTKGYGGLNWGGINIQADFGVEEDNVNDEPRLGRTQNDFSTLSLVYFPNPKVDPNTGEMQKRWYGQPSLQATTYRSDQKVTEAGNGLSLGPLHENRNHSLSTNFNYLNWYWAITHTWGEDTDFSNRVPDTENRLTDVAFNFQLGEKLNLGANVQVGETKDRDSGLVSDIDLYGLNLYYQATQKLSLNVGYSLNRERGEGDSSTITPVRRDTATLLTNVTWRVREARGKHPGVALSLEGLWQDIEDKVDPNLSQKTYQVFFKVSVTLMPRY